MKFILLVLAVLALVWLLRRSLGQIKAAKNSKAPKVAPPQAMLACAECGLHLPSGEALPGRGGVFCGDAHRTAFERAHPE